LGADLLDGAIVAVIAGVFGAAELVGRHPQYAGLIVRTSPGRKYVAVNMIAGVLAFAAARLLDVRFHEPDRVILVVTCGLAAITVLRSAPVTRAGLAGPAQVLQKLQDAYNAQLVVAVREAEAQANIRAADAVAELIEGLRWDSDAEALGAMCSIISREDSDEQRDKMAERIAKAGATDLGEVRLFSLALGLRADYTQAVLAAAAQRVREAQAALTEEGLP